MRVSVQRNVRSGQSVRGHAILRHCVALKAHWPLKAQIDLKWPIKIRLKIPSGQYYPWKKYSPEAKFERNGGVCNSNRPADPKIFLYFNCGPR